MNSIETYSSITTLIEKLIERENETISIYERVIHETGDSVVKPLLLELIHEQQHHRELLEKELEELNEQFELDEAIV